MPAFLGSAVGASATRNYRFYSRIIRVSLRICSDLACEPAFVRAWQGQPLFFNEPTASASAQKAEHMAADRCSPHAQSKRSCPSHVPNTSHILSDASFVSLTNDLRPSLSSACFASRPLAISTSIQRSAVVLGTAAAMHRLVTDVGRTPY